MVPPPRTTTTTTTTTYTTVILLFCTHCFANACLLSGWNDRLRCLYWNVPTCSTRHAWMLNWFASSQFHVGALLGALCYKTRRPHDEERLAHLTACLMVSNLLSGVFFRHVLNRAMAAVQVAFYLALLAALAVHVALTPVAVPTNTTLGRLSSFDPRRRLALSTIVVALLSLLSAAQVWDWTFGTADGAGTFYYLDDSADVASAADDAAWQSMANATLAQRAWTALLLAWSAALATVPQQKAVLASHAFCLFGHQVLLTGTAQGQRWMPPDAARSEGVAHFGALVLALLGWAY